MRLLLLIILLLQLVCVGLWLRISSRLDGLTGELGKKLKQGREALKQSINENKE